MKSQQEQFLNLSTRPARLKVEEAAWYLGFSPHEIPILMAEGLLKPLGRPPATGTKYFSTAALEELRKDEKWLARASDCIVEYWRVRNDRKTAHRKEAHDAPDGNGSQFTSSHSSARSRSARRRLESAME
jgi:hypothetical protein